MSARSSLVSRLFWTTVLGGCAAMVWETIALGSTAVVVAALILWHLDRPRRLKRRIRRVVLPHAGILARRRRQECFVDAYGNLICDGWYRERAYFAERTVIRELEERGLGTEADRLWPDILAIIEAVAEAACLPDEDDLPEDGIAYERFCVARLLKAGWRAWPTQASGDQGADIVAERDGLRLIIQCKRYGKPVGNAAVQEAAAACRFWSGDHAAVVSNAGFTPSARKLAAATDVLLLHHDDLVDFEPEKLQVAASSPVEPRPSSSVRSQKSIRRIGAV
ncbi:MAG: restriction endonuclease [Methylobacterium sp.]|uniref:restriction endonuclease n=1 Tax=Methylobacterium sp. TaxID=409 RepID=UPI0025FA364F|nr:restriction endonuclease [Methylobacterium sp.]MBX9931506.1 restriction endonuclease [Methylobacterium sp.]